MEVAVKSTEVTVPSKPLLRHHQREEMKGEIESMEQMLPQLKNSTDRSEVTRRVARLKKSLTEQSPVEISGAVKDKLYAEAKAIQESVSAGMLSQEEMRKNPAGSVGHHMRHEAANKKKILRWKNIQQMLDPTSDDPDLSNFERFRPTGAQDRFRGDAQINGVMSYRNVPQENWDLAFQGKGPDSALKQAERVSIEQQATKTRKPLTEEQRQAIGERLAKARAAKQAKQNESDQPAPIVEGEQVQHEGA